MLGGWLGAWLGLAMHGRWGWRSSGAGGFLAGLLLAGVAASLLVSQHIRIPAVLPAQRVVGCVSLVWGAWEMTRMLPELRWLLRWRMRWRSRSRWRRAPLRQQIKEEVDG
jgi:MFS family permease